MDTPANDEKYLTFFTHSGFQNQLIQVENGILLAWYLNRTLILPKAILGDVFGWSSFDKLQLEHQLRDSTTSQECFEYETRMERWGVPCPRKERYVSLPFDAIFDLSWAKQHVKMVVREEASDQWLGDHLGIRGDGNVHVDPTLMADEASESASFVDGDILYFRGGTRYDWRILDVAGRKPRLGKYAAALDIRQLRQRPEKLIHFTSLFGTGRLPIRRSEHYDFFRSLQRSITYGHPAIHAMTDIVTEKLGGHGNYIGIHIRSSDGWFVEALPDTVFSIVANIDRAVRSHRHQQTNLDLEDAHMPGTNDDGEAEDDDDEDDDDLVLVPPPSEHRPPRLSECVAAAKAGRTTLVYVATDQRDPRLNRAFDLIWQSYPCSFTLPEILSDDQDSDDDNIDPSSSSRAVWTILDQHRHPVTGASMRKFLLPMVDASIASRGWIFVGSKGSTFSGYIRRLYDIFWSNKKSELLKRET
ncbi:hypothetical protein BC940DRAFT_237189 [Gongronella butleri]|nr:hypothetical protein BC940DRAFT_237189 [Gongronella butleri]